MKKENPNKKNTKLQKNKPTLNTLSGLFNRSKPREIMLGNPRYVIKFHIPLV